MQAITLESPVVGVISQRDPVEHACRRRPWTRAFDTAALKNYEPIITKRTCKSYEELINEKGLMDLGRWLSYFT
jgi:cytochrome P450